MPAAPRAAPSCQLLASLANFMANSGLVDSHGGRGMQAWQAAPPHQIPKGQDWAWCNVSFLRTPSAVQNTQITSWPVLVWLPQDHRQGRRRHRHQLGQHQRQLQQHHRENTAEMDQETMWVFCTCSMSAAVQNTQIISWSVMVWFPQSLRSQHHHRGRGRAAIITRTTFDCGIVGATVLARRLCPAFRHNNCLKIEFFQSAHLPKRLPKNLHFSETMQSAY